MFRLSRTPNNVVTILLQRRLSSRPPTQKD
jgi:hypothetical protein